VAFMTGIRLAGLFYAELVGPLLAEEFPQLAYAAALLGPGSEVLGFDTPRSVDHGGPRLQVFPSDDDVGMSEAVRGMLARRLPATFRGYPVVFAVTSDPRPGHRVHVTGLSSWFTGQVGFDPRCAVTVQDWLAAPSQRLAEVTAGAVFHDGPGELTRARAALEWYPRDVWLYILACQWQRIAQEEAFPGRCAEAGDDLGSAVVTARIARDLMRLWLLMHRRYPPYSKWLGTAFARVSQETAALGAALSAAVAATAWADRERHLGAAYTTAAQAHNRLGLTPELDVRTRGFYDRPYQVLDAGRFCAALAAAISDPVLRQRPLTGAADQFIDSTDALGNLRLIRDAIAM
jgi:Domain of unknown function (DUF4037)